MRRDLFSGLSRPSNWSPESPPSLDGIKNIFLDFETTGVKWWEGDVPIGLALRTPDGKSGYYPWGHRGGGNLCEETMRRWCKEQLRNKHITNLNTKFEVHMARNFGIDLEEQGCTLGDVAHYAALLDDNRTKFNLEDLSQEFLGRGKVQGLIGDEMADYHAGEVAEYACTDVDLVAGLLEKFEPELDRQDLQRVRALEDRLIFPTAEMEKNAAYLDVDLLEEWIKESEEDLNKCIWWIHKKTGFKINPRSPKEKIKLFNHLGLNLEDLPLTEKGNPSFTYDALKQINHPVIEKLRIAAGLSEIRSKFLLAYYNWIDEEGWLRFSLHQLRSDDGGTVSGRYSSSDKNIQQVFNPKRQLAKYGPKYLIRKLFLPKHGKWLRADAAQIEFRLVAHYAEDPEILEAYRKDPYVSFHKVVWKIVKTIVDIEYEPLKDLNFAKIYGAGFRKVSAMMGVPYSEGKRFAQIWEGRFPVIKNLPRKASEVAEKRGYVKTILGRRARFPKGWNLHSALNRIVQGSAGDIMKLKLCEIHEARKETGLTLRMTLHDELDGDCPDDQCEKRVSEILNHQTLNLNVPILWEVKTGKNWAECV